MYAPFASISRQFGLALVIALALTFSWSRLTLADEADGVVRVKSAYAMEETIARVKKDIADQGIMFFQEVNQSQLAEKAGIKLNPSTLLTFGNPPLGTLCLSSNPDSGLDWAVRVLVRQDDNVRCGLRLDRAPPQHQGSRCAVQDGLDGGRVDHSDGEGEIAGNFLPAPVRRPPRCNKASPSLPEPAPFYSASHSLADFLFHYQTPKGSFCSRRRL